MSKIKLGGWFEIDEQEYLMYILRGYEVNEYHNMIIWYLDGKLHREDGPAVIHPDGTKMWFFNDMIHRCGGPAIIHSDGKQEWWNNDKLHREDGPAIICTSGSKEWYLNGKRHQEDGSAIVNNTRYINAWNILKKNLIKK